MNGWAVVREPRPDLDLHLLGGGLKSYEKSIKIDLRLLEKIQILLYTF